MFKPYILLLFSSRRYSYLRLPTPTFVSQTTGYTSCNSILSFCANTLPPSPETWSTIATLKHKRTFCWSRKYHSVPLQCKVFGFEWPLTTPVEIPIQPWVPQAFLRTLALKILFPLTFLRWVWIIPRTTHFIRVCLAWWGDVFRHLAIHLILCFSVSKELGGTLSKATEVITSYE